VYCCIAIARALIDMLGMLIMRFGATNAAQQRQSEPIFVVGMRSPTKNMWCIKYHDISRIPNGKMEAGIEFPTLPGSFIL
jgi:hypothetical protein